MSQRTVLVVEDEPLGRFALIDALGDEGYAVLEVSTVLEAIGLLGKYPDIDALVTDVDMPGGLNGLDLADLVARMGRRIAITIASGGHTLDRSRLPSNAQFFAKPYCLGTVIEELSTQLADIRRSTAGIDGLIASNGKVGQVDVAPLDSRAQRKLPNQSGDGPAIWSAPR